MIWTVEMKKTHHRIFLNKQIIIIQSQIIRVFILFECVKGQQSNEASCNYVTEESLRSSRYERIGCC